MAWINPSGMVGDCVINDQTDVVSSGTDNAGPLEAAINSANGKTIHINAGKYLVKRPLNLTATTYSLLGDHSERGTNAQSGDYYKTRIIYRPDAANAHRPMIKQFLATNPLAAIGPFIHEGISFEFADHNGIELGIEDLNGDGVPDALQDGTGQRYVFGPQFFGCRFRGRFFSNNYASDANGVVPRSPPAPALPRALVRIAKAFDVLFDNISMEGGDTQIRSYGCDKATFRSLRSQHSNIPFDMQGSGNFGVVHAIDGVQFEGWQFAAIRADGLGLTVSDARFEHSWAGATGMGRYNLTSAHGITCNVTAGSSTLTFNKNMTGILIPGLSILELSSGGNVDTVLVTAVNGTSATIASECFRFTWSASAASVLRIHGYGLIASNGDCSVVNSQGGGVPNCPLFVYVGNRGQMSIVSALGQQGSYGDMSSLCIGNNYGTGAHYMSPQMSFANCSQLIVANHPYVTISNIADNHGRNFHQGANRPPLQKIDEAFASVARRWAYTVRRGATANYNHHLIPFKRIRVGTYSDEYAWAFELPAGSGIRFTDEALPDNTAGNPLKFAARFKAPAGAQVKIDAEGAGGSNIATWTASGGWQSKSVTLAAAPGPWSATPTAGIPRQIRVYSPTAVMHLVGVTIEEIV